MKINRNMSAVMTNKQLLRTENRLQKSMERLSSGFKINSAGENPAGMGKSSSSSEKEQTTSSFWLSSSRL